MCGEALRCLVGGVVRLGGTTGSAQVGAYERMSRPPELRKLRAGARSGVSASARRVTPSVGEAVFRHRASRESQDYSIKEAMMRPVVLRCAVWVSARVGRSGEEWFWFLSCRLSSLLGPLSFLCRCPLLLPPRLSAGPPPATLAASFPLHDLHPSVVVLSFSLTPRPSPFFLVCSEVFLSMSS